mmetsp:Transcript_4783/g.19113  ORF Transcript_4783/g.19113 Transcript_4783/m.19113 type:complete len:395 (-) Transcript_4783:1304-2488(-)
MHTANWWRRAAVGGGLWLALLAPTVVLGVGLSSDLTGRTKQRSDGVSFLVVLPRGAPPLALLLRGHRCRGGGGGGFGSVRSRARILRCLPLRVPLLSRCVPHGLVRGAQGLHLLLSYPGVLSRNLGSHRLRRELGNLRIGSVIRGVGCSSSRVSRVLRSLPGSLGGEGGLLGSGRRVLNCCTNHLEHVGMEDLLVRVCARSELCAHLAQAAGAVHAGPRSLHQAGRNRRGNDRIKRSQAAAARLADLRRRGRVRRLGLFCSLYGSGGRGIAWSPRGRPLLARIYLAAESGLVTLGRAVAARGYLGRSGRMGLLGLQLEGLPWPGLPILPLGDLTVEVKPFLNIVVLIKYKRAAALLLQHAPHVEAAVIDPPDAHAAPHVLALVRLLSQRLSALD